MEPGTILAVVQISAKVLSLISNYYSGVTKAKADIDRLTKEISTFHNVLQSVERAVQHSPGKLPATSVAAIDRSLNYLTSLEEKLNLTSGGKVMKRVGFRALKWPFTRKEFEELITKLDRDKATLILALNSDQT